jgi:tRNA-modifying protein YgfZ
MTDGLLTGVVGIDALRNAGGAVAVRRDVLSAEGPDASTFLQSQLSQDISRLGEGETAWSFLLQPTGKLVGFFRVTRTGAESFRLDGDPGVGVGVEAALRRFLIRTKCTIALREGVGGWAVRGSELRTPPGAVPSIPGLPGYDLIDAAGADSFDAVDSAPDVARVAPLCLEYLRIAAGIPVWPYELSESTIPNATGLVGLAVSFTKGCYVGQELVERIDSRGTVTPRVLRRLRFDAPDVPTSTQDLVVGAELFVGGDAKGSLTSVAQEPGGSTVSALGYVHRDVQTGSPLHAGSPAGAVGSVLAVEIA